MKERPILFSAPMVRALLDGTKTQTRRVVKHRSPFLWEEPYYPTGKVLTDLPTQPGAFMEFRSRLWDDPAYQGSTASFLIPCPYGQPGDRLWVREAIRLVPDQEPDDGTGRVLSVYGADGSLTVADAWPWKRAYLPPMHCPRGLSRIDLEVTGVRVERLQDISEADAIAEGSGACPFVEWRLKDGGPFRNGYAQLWEQINGAGSWAANPWVWVVEFKAVRP